jgi:hypothetical protein
MCDLRQKFLIHIVARHHTTFLFAKPPISVFGNKPVCGIANRMGDNGKDV